MSQTSTQRGWEELINVDFPEAPHITEEARELTKRESNRFRGSVRMSLGEFWTEEEYEQFREKVLNTPLP